MTTNIIYPRAFHARTTTGTRVDNFARKVIAHMKQRPAYVIGSFHLSRAIAELEKAEWTVHTPPDGNIACALNRGRVHIIVSLEQAQKIQRLLESFALKQGERK